MGPVVVLVIALAVVAAAAAAAAGLVAWRAVQGLTASVRGVGETVRPLVEELTAEAQVGATEAQVLSRRVASLRDVRSRRARGRSRR